MAEWTELEEDLSRIVAQAQAEVATPIDVSSATPIDVESVDDQKETAVEGNEVAQGEDNEEPLPPMKKARARKTTEEKEQAAK